MVAGAPRPPCREVVTLRLYATAFLVGDFAQSYALVSSGSCSRPYGDMHSADSLGAGASPATHMTGVFEMHSLLRATTLALALGAFGANASAIGPDNNRSDSESVRFRRAQLGPRPFYLVDKLEDGPLKRQLTRCMRRKSSYRKSDFSIGHRGACLQFPEHTVESYVAAARQGAGILECDVTITKDLELVCRHAQCDLHTTTNILATGLAERCTRNFQPAVYDENGELVTPASAKCCTSDITLAEFKTLTGKMDAADRTATTVEDYISGPKATPKFRTDLYATGATLLSHAESIQLFESLGVQFTPELKGADAEVDSPPASPSSSTPKR